MKQAGFSIGMFSQRTAIVLVALFCLCVSDSAGPRLAPLPNPAVIVSPGRNMLPEAGCFGFSSQLPDQNKEPHAYLQIVGGSNYRNRDHHHDPQPVAQEPQAPYELQLTKLATTPRSYLPRSYKTAPPSVHKGRGPPSS